MNYLKHYFTLSLLFLFAFIGTRTSMNAQVTSVNYFLKYNNLHNFTDCYIIINKDTAIAAIDRIQISAQYSLVVPTGATMTVDSSFMPLIDNQFYDGTTSIDWNITNVQTAPLQQPTIDIYAITPAGSPTSFYNDLYEGDTVKLFRVSIDSFCSDNIRLYNENEDPEIMLNDFNQGFSLGTNINNLYDTITTKQAYLPSIYGDTTVCKGDSITLYTDSIPGARYAWGDYISTLYPNSTQITVSSDMFTGMDTVLFSLEVIVDSSSCSSVTHFFSVIIHDIPEVSITGSDQICIGTTTQLFPYSNGTWTVDSPHIASVDTLGLVTGLSAGTTFPTFTDSLGCSATTKKPISVSPIPIISIPKTELCVGEPMIASPNSGGTWFSSNDNIGSVTDAGLILCIQSGGFNVTYTDIITGCSSGSSETITCVAIPNTEITGPDEICIGETTTLSPTSGGTWASTSPGIAIVDVTGVVTGISHGHCTFVFTDVITGCESIQTDGILVNEQPDTYINGHDLICIGEKTSLFPSTGGSWSSTDDNVATVNNSGIVTGISYGTVTFSFKDSLTSCYSNPTGIITVSNDVYNGPTSWCTLSDVSILIGPEEVDVPENATFTWTPSIYLSDANVRQPLFTAPTTQVYTLEIISPTCSFTTQITAYAETSLVVENLGSDTLCIGETTTLSPTPNGTWICTDNAIGTITSSGLFTAISSGIGRCIYTSDSGCNIDTIDIIVLPEIKVTADDLFLCIGETTQTYPSSGGSWTSCNPAIATITANGQITALSAGTVCFTFISDNSVCSNNSTLYITVNNIPSVSFNDPSTLCSGDNIQLFSTTGGIWVSSDPSIATVTNSGLVTSYVPGSSCFYFTDASSGCISDPICLIFNDCSNPCDTNLYDLPQIFGTTYIDDNNNGIFDTGETVLSDVTISISSNSMMTLTNSIGNYHLGSDYGEYVLTATINEGNWVSDVLTTSINIIDFCNEGYHFGFVPNPSQASMSLSFSQSILRCDFETSFFIDFKNIGTEPFSGQLEFSYDPMTGYLDAGPVPDINDNNKLTFYIENLQPFLMKTFVVILQMPPASDPLPYMDFKVDIKDSNGTIINTYAKNKQLQCAFDPNDKSTYPDRDGAENLTLFDEEIDYMVRFQNTGNDIAYNIKVEDQLDANMDPNSIRILSSSHSVETMIESGKLIFNFKNINLVDSSVSYKESQGYISFRCRQLDFRSENTKIYNNANIFFDSNPPINTNEVLNTLVSTLCTSSVIYISNDICPGDSYLGYTEEGTYTDTIFSVFDCDSIRVLQLSYAETPTINMDTMICPDQEIYGYSTSGFYQDIITATTGCDTFLTLNLEVLDESDPLCLIANKNLEKQGINVFPNPIDDVLYIQGMNANDQVRISSLTGNSIPIEPKTLNGRTIISLDGLSPGVYFVSIYSERGLMVQKIIKINH